MQYQSSVPAVDSKIGCIRRMRFLDRDAATLGEVPRQVFFPEMLVVAEVEQRAVHVEQDGVDCGPVGRMGASLHVAYDITRHLPELK